MAPRLSIVLPVWREARNLEPLLAGLTADFGSDEILVVDGGSDDGSREVVRRFPRVTFLESARDRACQMNAGARAATGDILLFLHADTRLPPGARGAILEAITDEAVAGGRFDVRFERDRGLAWLVARLISLRSRWSGIATGDQALFVRREIFERLGGFADMPIMEDVDFTRRLKHAGCTASLRTLVVTSYRRWKRCGAFRTIVLMWTLRFLYWIGVHPDRLKNLYASVR